MSTRMMMMMVFALFLLCLCGSSAFTGRPVVSYSLASKSMHTTNSALHPSFKRPAASVEPSDKLDLPRKKGVHARQFASVKNLSIVAAAIVTAFGLMADPALASSLVDTLSNTDTVAAVAGDTSGFLQAFLLIFISEIGDKTFFIAGLLSAKYGKFISFTGSIGALAVMTIISTVLGQIFHAIPSSLTQGVPFDDYVAIAAFSYFGIKTLYDASQIGSDDNSGIEEEKEDAEKAVAELTQDQKRKSAIALIVQTFSLVFAAEIGDRSFLSTIALSAALNPFAVASGAIAAHASATGIAVAGGALMSKYLSEKVIGQIGGSLFVFFALTTLLKVLGVGML